MMHGKHGNLALKAFKSSPLLDESKVGMSEVEEVCKNLADLASATPD
jgi:hypothetical protein